MRAVAGAVRAAPGIRVAAVGPGTATELLERTGRRADLVPVEARATGLVAGFPSGPGRVLVAQADRAAATVADGLAGRGFDVTVVVAYRTELVGPPPADLDRLAACDVILFASGSAVESWHAAKAARPIGDGPPAVVIGPSTAAAARRLGQRVAAEAPRPDPAGVVAAVAEATGRTGARTMER